MNNQTISELQERIDELEKKIEDYKVSLNMYKRNYRESMKITAMYQKKYDNLVREYNRQNIQKTGSFGSLFSLL